MGLGMAGESARDVQPRVRRSRREAVERKKEVGMVGRGGKKMGWLRCTGLHRSETASRQSETRRRRHGRLARHGAVYYASRRARLALRTWRARGRPATDTLRSGRVTGHQFALQTTREPGLQTLER